MRTAISPDQIAAQMEGGTCYGLSAALYGQTTLKDGHVQETNFDTYRVLRMNEAPTVETYIVPSTAPPSGVGEPGTPVIAPAVANALLALTGKPTTSLPFVNRSRSRRVRWAGRVRRGSHPTDDEVRFDAIEDELVATASCAARGQVLRAVYTEPGKVPRSDTVGRSRQCEPAFGGGQAIVGDGKPDLLGFACGAGRRRD